MVGSAEPEVQSWLRAAGHKIRAVGSVKAALTALDKTAAHLVIADRDRTGLDVPDVCRALREDARLGEAWLLAITFRARRGLADAALEAGADDYLQRPFTRGQLLARARAGVRAAQQREDSRLLRTLMVTIPGAIYRTAWHAGQSVELISDEIERISGYPATNFIASTRRTLLSVVHPEDREEVERAIAAAADREGSFVLEYRIVRADGEVRWVLDRGQLVSGPGTRLWVDGAIFDITERRAAEELLRRQEIEQARTEELRASRGADRRGRRRRAPARSSATSMTEPSSAWSRWRWTCGLPRDASRPSRPPPGRSSSASGRSSPRPRPSCASWPAASTPPC